MRKPTKKAKISIIIALSLALVLILVLTLKSCSHDHAFGSEWVSDEVNHWHVCQDGSCDEVADLAAHTGGTVTETQRAVCEVCGHEYGKLAVHEHQFGEWKTKTAATCEAPKVECRVCTCGEEETRTIGAKLKHSYTAVITLPTCTESGYTTYTCTCGDSYTSDAMEALGHQMETRSSNLYHWSVCTNEGCAEMTEQEAHTPVSISVKKLDFVQTPMVGDVVEASDLHVYASCDCGTVYRVEKDLKIENAILKLGKNTVTVKLGKLSTTVDIDAVESYVALNGAVLGDTYVSSASAAAKDTGYADRETMGTYSNSFKVYLRINFSEILASKDFAANQYGAKVQFRFAVAEGEIADATTFTLKAFDPSTASFGVDFAKITFNNVKSGAYADIHWDNGIVLIDKQTLGETVSYDNGVITITVNYSAVEPYIDPTTGNALFAFATNTSGLKIASMENTEISGPKATVIYSTNAVAHEKHTYGSWETKSAATCEDAGSEQRVCSCGAVENRTGDPALGHSLALKYNDTYHWSACEREGCEYKTDHVAHSGGEATETEQAVCDGCGQSYGELKGEEKVLTDISGAITDDTYISSASGTAKDSSCADRDTMGTYSESFKVYLRFNFSEILDREDFAACKDGAKIRFSFAVAEGEVTDTTTFTLKVYEPATASFGVDFSEITFNSVKTGDYTDIHWNNGTELVAKQTLGDMVSYADGIITITLNYRTVEPYIDPTTGNTLFAFATNTKGVKIASMENAQLAHPAVTVTYNSGHVHAFTEEIATGVYLVSDECGKKAMYYKSCACGEVGTETFLYGDVIPHTYSDWETKTPATCTEDEVEYRVCSCGAEETRIGDAASDHHMVSIYDKFYHWAECDRKNCDYVTEREAHYGGTATDTEKAVCENCGQPYGGLAHEHSYTSVVTAPTCTAAGYTTYSCDCGSVYTADEVAALDHNMVIKYNEVSHWSECDRVDCGYATEQKAHHGGTATETERAVCEACNQPYGELKETVTLPVTIPGRIVADTYVSANATAKDTNYADKKTMGTNSNSFKVYLRFNFSDILGSEVYADYKNSASVQFTFAVAEGEVSDTTTFTLKAFDPSTASFGVDFAKITFNNVKSADIHWDNGIVLIDKQTLGETVSYDNGIITITLDYRDIEQYIDPVSGDALFAFATNTSGLKIASMENTEFDHPAVTVTFSNRHVHTYTEEVAREEYLVSANCGENAVYYKSCACGEVGTETFQYGDVIPHTYSDWETKTPATCTEDEVEYRVCSCGAEETRTGDVAPCHTLTQVEAQGATCTEIGWNAYEYCSGCDYTTYEEIAALGHSYGDLIPAQTEIHTRTELKAGVDAHYFCDVCDTYFTEEKAETTIEALTGVVPTHSYGSWIKTDSEKHWKECSCGLKTEEGNHVYTDDADAECDTCGHNRVIHNCGNAKLIEGQAATCTVDGWTDYYQCSCGKQYADKDCANEIADLDAWKSGVGKLLAGHTLTQVEAQGATCTEIGWNAYEYCSGCDYTTYEEIAALGHSYGNLIPAQTEIHTQTELKAGVDAHYFCDVCDTYFTEKKAETTIEALTGVVPTHSYGSWIKTDLEKHWKECSCGLKSEEGSHVYTDDAGTSCDTCGYIRVIDSSGPVTIPGRIVDDTYVSSADATAKNTNYADKETMGTYSSTFKVYMRFNFSDVLGSEDIEANEDSAKVQFAFAVSDEGELSDATTFTLKAFSHESANFGVDFSEITFNSVKNGAHSDIHWDKGTALVDAQTQGEVVSYDEINKIITITLDYSAIKPYIDPETGNALFAFATNTKNLKIASMENDTIVAPAVKVTFGE